MSGRQKPHNYSVTTPKPSWLLRMDSVTNQNLWSFIDQERKTATLSGRLSVDSHEPNSHLASARTSSASITSFQLLPTGAETPWTLSPIHASPPPSLLYHCIASLHRHKGNISSVTVTGNFIFTGSETNRIHTWSQPDCNEMGYIKASVGGVRALLGSEKLLFSAHADRRIRVWDVSSKGNFKPKKITTLPHKSTLFLPPWRNTNRHKDIVSCMAYNHEEKILYTGSHDTTVKVWEVSEKRCVDTLVAHEGQINAIEINQSDGSVFTGSSDGTVKIWRRVFRESTHSLTMTLRFQNSPVNALALSSLPSGCFLYSGSSDGLINFWEKELASCRFNHGGFLQNHQFSILCLVALGDLVLSGSEDATIRIWRRELGNAHSCLVVMDGHHGPVKCLAASFQSQDYANGLLVYSASLDRTFKVWRVKVCPTDQRKEVDSEGKVQSIEENAESLTIPVLSPSWVEKKIQF